MKKTIVLIYGLSAYILFLITILYAIGFIGNMFVPKTIDSGIESSFTQSVLINIILLSIFAIQHTVMARPAFKNKIAPVIGPATERSTFVLLSSLALLLLFWKWHPITITAWHIENKTITIILNIFYFAGWVIVFLSTFMINHFELLGLQQVFDNLKDKLTHNPKFQTNYFYKFVRHPLMSGFIITFWATPVMSVGHLIFAIITTLYIFIAVKYLEERDLKKSIGKKYEEYQKKVPMIIPFIKNKK